MGNAALHESFTFIIVYFFDCVLSFMVDALV